MERDGLLRVGPSAKEMSKWLGHAVQSGLLGHRPLLPKYEQADDAKVLEWEEAIYRRGGISRSDNLQASVHMRGGVLKSDRHKIPPGRHSSQALPLLGCNEPLGTCQCQH